MYFKAKSCVKTSVGYSDYFYCNVGLRQGENLSPILFSLFLNDLKDFLASNVVGINLPCSLADDCNFIDVENYVYLFLLLYADDTVLLAETANDMQTCLNSLQQYCEIYGLNINISKTKVMVFSRGKIRNLPDLFFNGEKIDITWDYKYLGVVFNYNNKFNKAIKAQYTSAMRAMFALIRKARQLDLPLDIQLDLFDKCVLPVLLYGSEIWAFENLSLCEKLQLKFLKIVLNIKQSTTTCMVLGEVGKFPVVVDATCRQLCFWYKLMLNHVSVIPKLSVLMLRLHMKLYLNSKSKLPWLTNVHRTLNDLGLSYIWQDAAIGNCPYTLEKFKCLVNQRLKDQFIQSWQHDVFNSSICVTYRVFKSVFQFEPYLINLSSFQARCLLKFRVSCHKLPIQKLRYENILRENRNCTLCNLNEIGDEFHYLFLCQFPLFKENRSKFLPKYYQHHPNTLKFYQLFNSHSCKKLSNLSRFVNLIMVNV